MFKLPEAIKQHPVVRHLRTTWHEFGQDGGVRLSAAMAYYILFVMAPALLLLTSLTTRFLGSAKEGGVLYQALQDVLGDQLAGYLFGFAVTTADARASVTVSLLGGLALVYAVAVFYNNIQSVFNRMWRVRVRPGAQWTTILKTRVRRFTVMLLPVAVLAIATLTTTIANWLERLLGSGLLSGVFSTLLSIGRSSIVVFVFAWLSFAALYAFLPDARVPRKVAIFTSLAAATGWTLGTWLFGRYLSWSSGGFSYGTVSWVFVLLIWLNYSSQLVLLGAKLSKVWTESLDGQVDPLPYAAIVKMELETPE